MVWLSVISRVCHNGPWHTLTMAQLDKVDRLATQATSAVGGTLQRLRSLAGGFVVGTIVVATATFATGWWVFNHSRTGWVVVGGVICLVPVIAALAARWFVGATAKAAPQLMDDISQLIRTSRHDAGPLIDHDTGRPLAQNAKSLSELRTTLKERRTELPALFAGVRAITSVPGLLAIALLGTLAVGALGTILLLVGLFR